VPTFLTLAREPFKVGNTSLKRLMKRSKLGDVVSLFRLVQARLLYSEGRIFWKRA